MSTAALTEHLPGPLAFVGGHGPPALPIALDPLPVFRAQRLVALEVLYDACALIRWHLAQPLEVLVHTLAFLG